MVLLGNDQPPTFPPDPKVTGSQRTPDKPATDHDKPYLQGGVTGSKRKLEWKGHLRPGPRNGPRCELRSEG